MKNIWLLLVLLCNTSYAQLNIKVVSDKFLVKGLTEVEVVGNEVLTKTAPTETIPTGRIFVKPEGKIVLFSYAVEIATNKFVNFTKSEKEDTLVWSWTQPGQIQVKFTVIDLKAGNAYDHTETVEIAGIPPKPDVPDVVPVVKLDNLSVLFVYEPGDIPLYDKQIRQTLQSTDLKVWFQQQIPQPDGLSRARWYDKDTDFKTCNTTHCKWMSSPPEIPGMIVGNDQQIVYKGKILPIDDIKKLVLQYKK